MSEKTYVAGVFCVQWEPEAPVPFALLEILDYPLAKLPGKVA